MSDAPKRVPVDFDYAAIHPQFLKGLARMVAAAYNLMMEWVYDLKFGPEKSPFDAEGT